MIAPLLFLIAWVLLGSTLALLFLALTLRIAGLLGELWDWLGWWAARRPRAAKARRAGAAVALAIALRGSP